MAGASVSEMILFIAALVVAASVAGTLTTQVDRVSDSLSARSLDVSNEVRADVAIISDAGSPGTVYDSGTGNVTLLVRNTGSSDLPASSDAVEVLVNGTYVTDFTVTVESGGPGWTRGGVVSLEIDQPLAADTAHRIKIVVRGDEELFEFRTQP
ncbi:flagellar protein G [Halobaculum sp. MBLA0147]|uniref:flagellar protein G n=1 Tax=Halobaculum sp. MBLA0147 TaxID=3079934 RepID=UPI00352556DA